MPRPSPEINCRDDFADLCNHHGLTRRALEIGVEKAEFARSFLDRWRGFNLTLIDPWTEVIPGYREKHYPREADFLLAMAVLTPHAHRVTVLRLTFADVLTRRLIPTDPPLDFGNIDGNHAEAAEDIAGLWPFIRPGGMLAGHDYDARHPEVIQAVDAFEAANGVPVWLTRETDWPSWYAYKPPAPPPRFSHRFLLESYPGDPCSFPS